MERTDQDQEILAINQRGLSKLTRVIDRTQKKRFTLILVRCNYVVLREQILKELKYQCQFQTFSLPRHCPSLFTAVEEVIINKPPSALIITNFSLIENIDDFLISTNQERNKFQDYFSFPIVLFCNDITLKKLTRLAPDFNTWGGVTINFELENNQIVDIIQNSLERIFREAIEAGSNQLKSNINILGSNYFTELEFAKKDLKQRNYKLSSELEGGLQFVFGREEYIQGNIENACKYYEQGLNIFKNSESSQWQGLLLFHLACCHGLEKKWQKAKEYLEECIATFKAKNHWNLVAKFINYLGKIFQNLEDWKQLADFAKQNLTLHQEQKNVEGLAQCYGWLAQVKVKESNKRYDENKLQQACKHAQKALKISDESTLNLEEDRGFYFLVLAQAEIRINKSQEALKNLERARNIKYLEDKNPELYLEIIETFRIFYFLQKQYKKAFEFKQEYRAIEQKYGMTAFIGAGRLQARKEDKNINEKTESDLIVAEEISNFGRQKDLEKLLEKVDSTEHKLIIIHGESGVGKSSIIHAGLLPELENIYLKKIQGRKVLPIILWTYTDWIEQLDRELAESLNKRDLKLLELKKKELKPEDEKSSCSFNLHSFLRKLEILTSDNYNPKRLVVLIFDQFEEFFFACKERELRREFIEFLRDCLNNDYLKIILSLREDYLHYLLENERQHIDLDSIANDILTIQNRHYLGNFSKTETKEIIHSLVQRSQFKIDSDLMEQLIEDLAENADEIRPIELQIIGSQLQSLNITKLQEYENYEFKSSDSSPKTALVINYLDEIIQYCGSENKGVAELILYLLTENNTRPTKTHSELLKDFSQQSYEKGISAQNFNEVLDILVLSGLILLIPGIPERYQLVHDYLVSFIQNIWTNRESQQKQSPLTNNLQVERDIDRRKIKPPEISKNAIQSLPLIKSNPYKGLQMFREEDSALFFGRELLVENLHQKLYQTNIILLLGASGSGKSSLVRAGLIPKLSKSFGSNFSYFVFTPQDDPFRALYESLIGKGYQLSEAQIALKGESETFSEVINILKPDEQQWLIFIDQFEEIFTLCSQQKIRNNFIKSIINLVRLGDISIKVVIAMRADYFAIFSQYSQFAKLLERNIQLISEISSNELREVIVGPAMKHGVSIEEDLIEQIIRDVGQQSSNLPLLQYTLFLLWQSEYINSRVIKLKTYKQIGGIITALTWQVENIYNNLSLDKQKISQIIFFHLLDFLSNGEIIFRKVFVEEILSADIRNKNLIREVINEFINGKILVPQSIYEKVEIEKDHENSIRRWYRLNNWIKKDREKIIFQRKIENAAKEWESSRKKTNYLLSKKILKEAKEFQGKEKYPFSDLAKNFVNASIKYQRREREKFKNWGTFLIAPLIGTNIVGYFIVREIRLNIDHKLITECQGKGFCSGRIEALERRVKAGNSLKFYDLQNADLQNVNLQNADLQNANLSNVNLSGANLLDADLQNVNFLDADLQNANLSGAKLYLANLYRAKLYLANLSGAKLYLANLLDANLSNANLLDANLSSTNLSSANLLDANLSNANLSDANLSSVTLKKADLSGANLSNAYFERANLQNANLPNANLQNANLQNANLQNANFTDTENLNNSQIKLACNWEQAYFAAYRDRNKEDGEWEWVVDEKKQQAKIKELKEDKASDPKEKPNCDIWKAE